VVAAKSFDSVVASGEPRIMKVVFHASFWSR
jgi:hypothetical protein